MKNIIRSALIFVKFIIEFLIYKSSFKINLKYSLFKSYKEIILTELKNISSDNISDSKIKSTFYKKKLYEKEFVAFELKNFFVFCYPFKKILVPRVLQYYLIISFLNFILKRKLFFVLHYGDKTDICIEEFYFFTFCRSKNFYGQLLIPDQEMVLQSEKLKKKISQLVKLKPFENRDERAYWRGSTTGGDYSSKNWEMIPRAKLVKLGIKYPSIIDAKFSNLCQGAKIGKNNFTLKFTDKKEAESRALDYKIVIDVDGNTLSWSRPRWLSSSGSLLLKQHSNDEQWYSSLFRPNFHYVELNYDLSNLVEKINALRLDFSKYVNIITNGERFANLHFSRGSALLYLMILLRLISKK